MFYKLQIIADFYFYFLYFSSSTSNLTGVSLLLHWNSSLRITGLLRLLSFQKTKKKRFYLQTFLIALCYRVLHRTSLFFCFSQLQIKQGTRVRAGIHCSILGCPRWKVTNVVMSLVVAPKRWFSGALCEVRRWLLSQSCNQRWPGPLSEI